MVTRCLSNHYRTAKHTAPQVHYLPIVAVLQRWFHTVCNSTNCGLSRIVFPLSDGQTPGEGSLIDRDSPPAQRKWEQHGMEK